MKPSLNKLRQFKHKIALSHDVFQAILPIHEDLSDENLFERCLGDTDAESNTSFNYLIWKTRQKPRFFSSIFGTKG